MAATRATLRGLPRWHRRVWKSRMAGWWRVAVTVAIVAGPPRTECGCRRRRSTPAVPYASWIGITHRGRQQAGTSAKGVAQKPMPPADCMRSNTSHA